MSVSDQDPAIDSLDEEKPWKSLAQLHWEGTVTTTGVKNQVIKNEIWDVLEKEGFPSRSLQTLENLQILERYLWPGYSEASTNHHVLLVVLIVTAKCREKLPVWNVFSDDSGQFSSLFRRILSLSLDSTLSNTIRTHVISFLISAFQSLDSGIVRKECAPLVSIGIWHNLATEAAREQKLAQYPQFKRPWRAATKKYEAADEATKARLRFERGWLFALMIDFAARLHELTEENIIYCERIMEFLTDLESQLPTRRYVNTLTKDLHLLALIHLSPMFKFEGNGLFRDLFVLLRHFVNFPVDDSTGTQYTQLQSHEAHCANLARLQKLALKHFKDKLAILALNNYASIDRREDLDDHLKQLTDDELSTLCTLLHLRIIYPSGAKIQVTRQVLLEALVSMHERRRTFREVVKDLSVLPTETSLYDPTLLRNEHYDGDRSLAVPKINLQYLSVGDFLWRSFVLYRCESFFAVRKEMEETIKRMQPRESGPGGGVAFSGFSRMAIPIAKPAIIDVAPPKVGHERPEFVRAEIGLDVRRLADSVRREWESLKQDDVIFLLAVEPLEGAHRLTNGHSTQAGQARSGLKFLRTAEIVQVQDGNGRPIRENIDRDGQGYRRPQRLRLLVNLDATAYKSDNERKSKGTIDVYESINVIVRRKGRENNFKRVLETIQSLALADIPVPGWLQDVFLGYGDPNGATYSRLENRLKSLDLRDTFLNWQHIVESLPGKQVVQSSKEGADEFGPPYVLETCTIEAPPPPKSSKKHHSDDAEVSRQPTELIKVSTYSTPNNGPYLTDLPKVNQIRFTPMQVEAITSGTQPGLTVIVGPPGTGKTDVATQIINNIYHDFPKQRTLLIAHSNQALNQLFQKIMSLDIDEHHLLRLGHGEEDLETDVSYSKHGRVESFLDNRGRYLAEVGRLAANLEAPGAHWNSCETAGYFHSVYVIPAWSKFWDNANAPNVTVDEIINSFPFYPYFQDAPQPLFPPSLTKEQTRDIAAGCQRHIDRMFIELEKIRPFEILRTSRDRANYLLVKEARIIAMTSTHAAMRRQEIPDLGFHYDNVVMEEAAQITEIENFIPLALQNPKNNELPVQRVVLCGDHLQNSPIIQSLAFRQFANLEQSLFLRLVRLGVSTINLDYQGRARPSIAKLYKWRYHRLENLPNVLTAAEFRQANAGFRFDHQFIDVPDYKGRGESQPTPHYFQNLGEAEYAVAIYQYMRLLGYPASKISILAMYAGQSALIKDVLNHRCAKNRLFGLPKIVTTVDKYQGEQNDYVILSLTRTARIGYLRDIRRLTVALSRARLGLYILGRRQVFKSCYELSEAFEQLSQRPDRLMVTTGEMFPTQRLLDDEVKSTEMVGVEHLGEYVYEMTKAKIEALKASGQGMPAVEQTMEVMELDEADDVMELDDEDDAQSEELDDVL